MLTKECKDVLKNIKILTNNTDDVFGYAHGVSEFCMDHDPHRTYNFTNYEDQINSIMGQLMEDEYIEKIYNDLHFYLTQRGLHPEQFILHDILSYIADKWIEVLALVVSIVALGLSIAAFCRSPQSQQTSTDNSANITAVTEITTDASAAQ